MLLFTENPAPVDFWSANAADWLSAVGTVGATVVALGLGVGGFMAAQKDRRDREAMARRDKARVYCWADTYVPAYELGGVAWIKNDTDLPIHHVSVNIFTDPVPGQETLNMGTSLLLAPKETRTIDLDAGSFSKTLAHSRVHIFVTFTDVDGFIWTRHPNGALTPFPWDHLQMPTPLDKGRPVPD